MNKFYTENHPLDKAYIYSKFPEEVVFLEQFSENYDLKFEVEGDKLMLINEVGTPLFIEIDKKLLYHKKFFQKHSLYKDPLAKALGLKKGKELPKVLDATAGLLGDTLLMMSYGLQVDVIERNPLVSLLITNAIKNASVDIHFKQLSALNLEDTYPVIFFDPMYSEKNSKAAPKKEMQVFRTLVGEDFDRVDVAIHLRSKTSRLVIKRSVKAKSLLEKPSMTFCGKSTCYDVYLC